MPEKVFKIHKKDTNGLYLLYLPILYLRYSPTLASMAHRPGKLPQKLLTKPRNRAIDALWTQIWKTFQSLQFPILISGGAVGTWGSDPAAQRRERRGGGGRARRPRRRAAPRLRRPQEPQRPRAGHHRLRQRTRRAAQKASLVLMSGRVRYARQWMIKRTDIAGLGLQQIRDPVLNHLTVASCDI